MRALTSELIPRSLRFVLVALTVLLLTLTVPGVFTVDEVNYIVTVTGLARGSLMVPGTEEFPPSKELYGFDPEPHHRTVTSTPVFSLVGSLYAFLALPFYPLGWRGLAAINTIAFLAIAALVFAAIRRSGEFSGHSQNPLLPWLAFSVFVFGGFSVEYAVGLWPHMLAAALCTGSVVSALASKNSGARHLPVIAGLLAGLAIGVREQNVAIAAGVGAGIFLWSPRRFRAISLFITGLAVPVFAAFLVNGFRLGAWTPFPKAGGYAFHVSGAAGGLPLSVWSLFVAFASKLVNFAWFPGVDDPIKSALMTRDAATGAYLTMGVVKKALLQSAPWIAPAFTAMALSWTRHKSVSDDSRTEIRFLSLVILPVLLVFFFAGARSVDGWSFNQRYFLEIVPLSAIALVFAVRSRDFSFALGGIGFVAGVLLALAVMAIPNMSVRISGILWIPLFLSFAGCVAFFSAGRQFAVVLSIVIGLSVGWAFLLHVGGDVLQSSLRRNVNYERAQVLNRVLPDRVALFVYWGTKDVAGPALLSKDLVLIDVWADDGTDAPLLAGAALSRGRRVVVLADGFPQKILDAMSAGRVVRTIPAEGLTLLEIRSIVPSDDPLVHSLARGEWPHLGSLGAH